MVSGILGEAVLMNFKTEPEDNPTGRGSGPSWLVTTARWPPVRSASGKPILVVDAVKELLALKKRNFGVHYLRDLTSRLQNRFGDAFGKHLISSITAPEITCWLDSLSLESRTRQNIYTALSTLFDFAQSRGYLAEGLPTAMTKVKRPKANRPRKDIYTAEEFRTLIRVGLREQSPALETLLCQGLAGVLSEELRQSDPRKDRVRWGDIHLDGKEPELHIRQEVSKTGEERWVYLSPSLAAWLRLFRKEGEEPVFIGTLLSEAYERLSKASKIEWKRNGLRKAFNTYHAALSGSLDDTAKEAGNSAKMIRRHYRKEQPQVAAEARKWFSTGPKLFEKEVKAYRDAEQRRLNTSKETVEKALPAAPKPTA